MLGYRCHISEKLCLVKDPDEEISKNLDEICRQIIGEAKKNKKKQEHYDLGQFDVRQSAAYYTGNQEILSGNLRPNGGPISAWIDNFDLNIFTLNGMGETQEPEIE